MSGKKKKMITATMNGSVTRIQCNVGDEVFKGNVLAVITGEDGTEMKLESSSEGKIIEIRKKVGESIAHGRVLFVIEEICAHLKDYHGICCECGADIKNLSKDERTTVAVSHVVRGLRQNISSAMEASEAHKTKLLESKKLILLLDLDLTVIQATRGPESEKTIPPALKKYSKLEETIHHFFAKESYWIKLRPGAKEFIATISQMFEIHVYTASEREYADQIIALLDPENRYFQGRVLTRTESPHHKQKYIQRLFPFSVELVLIVDDSNRAWISDEGLYHLYNIHPFIFFKQGSNSTLITSPSDVKEPEETDKIPDLYWINKAAWKDDELPFCLEALTKVHQSFFSREQRISVNHVLSNIRSQVLKGVHILFSNIFPKTDKPEDLPLWKLCLSFGAECSIEKSNSITHVLCGRNNTDKVHWGKKEGKHVIHISWLIKCFRHWSKPSEALYSTIVDCSTKELNLIMKEAESLLLCYPVVKREVSTEEIESMMNFSSEEEEEEDESDESSEEIDAPPTKKRKLE